MARCPHCGEPVTKVQERCFACGQKVRGRVRRGERPLNAAIFVLAAVLVLAGVIGIVVVSNARAKRARSQAFQQEQARIRDSVRIATQAQRDSAKAVARSEGASALTEEINKIEERFDLVKRQVVKDRPSPAQSKLISQISAEIMRLRQLAIAATNQPGPGGDSVKVLIRDGERAVRTLISDLTRAPRK